MTVTTDNVILEMGKAWRRQFADMPLILSDESQRSILLRAADYKPPRLLAMWIMYIEDEREKDWGLTIDRFLRDDTLNKWAARLGTHTVSKAGGSSPYPPGYNVYICENSFQLKVTPPSFCWGERGYPGWDGSRKLPDRHPGRCPLCNGAMYRIHSSEYKRLNQKRTADLMVLPDPEPGDLKTLAAAVAKPIPDAIRGFDEPVDELGGDEIDFF